ncbi:hypothetical protein JW916_12350 [Candidatus Sumerlaeota bacterium]|nr:hypothetical protein [Candidatus Sumerlaeota bacterium]
MTDIIPKKPETGVFPRVDRSIVTTGTLFEESDEKAFWLSKSPLERLEAIELYRQIAYGYDSTTARLQRVLETADFPPS